MYDLQKTVKECRKMASELWIPFEPNTTFLVNPRFRSRWGCCKKFAGGYLVELNPQLLNGSLPVEALKTTILHELLHTCYGCMNHGKTWKEYADRVRERYGLPVQTRNDYYEYYNVTDTRANSARYALVCESCGMIHYRKQKSQAVKHPEMYRCNCGGKLSLHTLSNGQEAAKQPLPAFAGM